MLLMSEHRRFSTDIDIVMDPGVDVVRHMEIAAIHFSLPSTSFFFARAIASTPQRTQFLHNSNNRQ